MNNSGTGNSIYTPSNIEITQHTETPEMSERREKYTLIQHDKETKIIKGAAIGGAITTAALIAANAFKLISIPTAAIVLAGAATLAGGLAWIAKKIQLNSMIDAYKDQSIGELAASLER